MYYWALDVQVKETRRGLGGETNESEIAEGKSEWVRKKEREREREREREKESRQEVESRAPGYSMNPSSRIPLTSYTAPVAARSHTLFKAALGSHAFRNRKMDCTTRTKYLKLMTRPTTHKTDGTVTNCPNDNSNTLFID